LHHGFKGSSVQRGDYTELTFFLSLGYDLVTAAGGKIPVSGSGGSIPKRATQKKDESGQQEFFHAVPPQVAYTNASPNV
jgi:hypothetical protein